MKRVEEITGKKISFYKCDLLNVEGLSGIFENHKISSVIHFAAMKAVGESMQFPLLYYKNNLIGMINLLEVIVILNESILKLFFKFEHLWEILKKFCKDPF